MLQNEMKERSVSYSGFLLLSPSFIFPAVFLFPFLFFFPSRLCVRYFIYFITFTVIYYGLFYFAFYISSSLFYSVFGSGRRQCAGEPLARAELFLFLAALFHRFTITVVKEEAANNDNPHINLPPKYQVVATPRHSATQSCS